MATSVLTIEELTGSKRRLDLIGPGLPIQGAAWGGQTILATQWNAGNPEATQHVLGVQEDPSAWEGEWSTTMLIGSPCQWTDDAGSAQKIVIPATLDLIFESLKDAGQLLRVTWTNQQSSATIQGGQFSGRQVQKVRLGRLQAYKAEFRTVDNLKWSATFEWISKGTAPRTLASPQDDVLAASRDAIIIQNGLVASIAEDEIRASRKTKNQTSQFRLGDLESLTQAPLAALDNFAQLTESATRELKDLGDIIVKTRAVPFQLANRALSIAINGVSVANTFLDEISRKAPEAMTTRSDAALLAQAVSYYGKSQSQAQLMVSINQRLSQQARVKRSSLSASSTPGQASQMSQADIQAVYLPKDGDTFAKISARFYGTGDLGTELARVNGCAAYAISPPKRVALVIPTAAIINARVAAGL